MLLSATNKNRPFWILTFTTITVLVVSQLIQDGAFMDGMLYSSVSKNLADGIGTFWNPHCCKTYQSSFHEQPPLYFGMLAIFFKLFGSSLYVERLFCFVCLCITALYIHKLWKNVFTHNDLIARNSWLPVLFWISIPICFWAYTNFVEEVPMSMFAVIAVYYAYIALFQNKNILYNLTLAGIFIFLSSLTKGFQGLFPLVAAGAYWLVTRNISFKKMLLYSLLLIGIPALIYACILLTSHEAYSSYQSYFKIRIAGTFKPTAAKADSRFFLLSQLCWQLLPIVVVSGLMGLISKKQNIVRAADKTNKQNLTWFLLIGLSGSLPLMVTMEQSAFYLVTSLPFFAMAIAIWQAENCSGLIDKIKTNTKSFKVFVFFAYLLLIASFVFTFSQIGEAKRDKEMLQDVYAFGKIIPHGEIISIPHSMCMDFSFKEYLIRYFYISADDVNMNHHYLIVRKDLSNEPIPANYTHYPLLTKKFDLFVMQ